MPDYGRPLEFGYFLVPNADDPLLDIAAEVERLGLDLIGVQDHPYQRRYVDTWTLLSMIAARTSRLRVFPDVACLPLRPPAVLAKAAASLDVLSGGRCELGLGSGAFWDAIEAYGGRRRTPGEARAALGEAIEVIHKVWSGERALRYDGVDYQLRGAQSGPVPVHPIEVWLGVTGPKSLALTGRLADGWLPSSSYVPPDRLPELNTRIDESAVIAGRTPQEIRRCYNLMGVITDGPSKGFLEGPVQQWVEELTDLAVGSGMDTFIFAGDPGEPLHRFAEEIAPAVRAAVKSERGS